MFYNPLNRERFEIDHPEEHLDFHGYKSTKRGKRVLKKLPQIWIDGILITGIRQPRSQYSPHLCTTGCKRAKPWTSCKCSCAGKNHGKDYIGAQPVTEQDIKDEFGEKETE